MQQECCPVMCFAKKFVQAALPSFHTGIHPFPHAREQAPTAVQSQLGTVPLVSLVNEVDGKPLSWLAGSAVARANRTDLQTLEDINHQRVSACRFAHLSGLRQVRWTIGSHIDKTVRAVC